MQETMHAAAGDENLLLSLVFISILIFSTKALGHISSKLGMPSVVGKIATGIILGPAVLGIIHETSIIESFSELGVILLLFIAGIETDFATLRKNLKGSAVVAVLGVVTPLVLGWAVGSLYGFKTIQSIYIGTLLVATSVSISVQVLKELKHLKSREGVTVLGAAVIDDILGLIILTIVLGMAGTSAGASHAGALDLAWKIPAFFAFVFLVGKFLVPCLLKWASNFQVTVPLYAVGIAIAIAVGYVTETFFSIEPIVGAYLMGVMISFTPFQEKLFHQLETIAMSVFVPVFFGAIGLSVSFSGLGASWSLFVVLFLVAVASKLFACALGRRICGMTARESWITGAAMISRGEVGLIVATIGVQNHIISQDIYTIMVLISITTTLITPIMLKSLISPKLRLEANPTST